MHRDRLQALVDEHYPYGDLRVESAGDGRARLRKLIESRHLRLGGTVAGPTLMALADAAVYLALQATPAAALEAVTSQLTMHFLRKPAARDLIAEARILRSGRTLAVGEVLVYPTARRTSSRTRRSLMPCRARSARAGPLRRSVRRAPRSRAAGRGA
jgi:uncharacterized protein (TIGR00369 family)